VICFYNIQLSATSIYSYINHLCFFTVEHKAIMYAEGEALAAKAVFAARAADAMKAEEAAEERRLARREASRQVRDDACRIQHTLSHTGSFSSIFYTSFHTGFTLSHTTFQTEAVERKREKAARFFRPAADDVLRTFCRSMR
jgi:hypothetical protein